MNKQELMNLESHQLDSENMGTLLNFKTNTKRFYMGIDNKNDIGLFMVDEAYALDLLLKYVENYPVCFIVVCYIVIFVCFVVSLFF